MIFPLTKNTTCWNIISWNSPLPSTLPWCEEAIRLFFIQSLATASSAITINLLALLHFSDSISEEADFQGTIRWTDVRSLLCVGTMMQMCLIIPAFHRHRMEALAGPPLWNTQQRYDALFHLIRVQPYMHWSLPKRAIHGPASVISNLSTWNGQQAWDCGFSFLCSECWVLITRGNLTISLLNLICKNHNFTLRSALIWENCKPARDVWHLESIFILANYKFSNGTISVLTLS